MFLEEIQARMEALGTAYLRRAARLREELIALDASATGSVSADVSPHELRAACVFLQRWIDSP